MNSFDWFNLRRKQMIVVGNYLFDLFVCRWLSFLFLVDTCVCPFDDAAGRRGQESICCISCLSHTSIMIGIDLPQAGEWWISRWALQTAVYSCGSLWVVCRWRRIAGGTSAHFTAPYLHYLSPLLPASRVDYHSATISHRAAPLDAAADSLHLLTAAGARIRSNGCQPFLSFKVHYSLDSLLSIVCMNPWISIRITTS